MFSNFEKKVRNLRMAVIGDYCLDNNYYINANLDRKADYANNMSYFISTTKSAPGGAGNIVKNFISLGCQVSCVGYIGDDGYGYELKRKLEELGADTSFLFSECSYRTNTYIRPIRYNCDTEDSMNELIITNNNCINEVMSDQLVNAVKNIIENVDAVVLNEQFFNEETAVITRYVKNKLNELAVVYSNKVFFVDSRKYVSLYKSMYIKCNQYEVTDAMLVVGEKVNVSNTLEQFGCFLSKSNKAFFMTLAGGGVDVYQDERRLGNVPAFNMEGEIDTCGAGDSATVGIVIGLCLGGSVLQAAQLGNAVAAVTIKKIGRTGEANMQEVFDVLRVTI